MHKTIAEGEHERSIAKPPLGLGYINMEEPHIQLRELHLGQMKKSLMRAQLYQTEINSHAWGQANTITTLIQGTVTND